MARTTDAGPKPRNDAYTGLLAISFLALVGGCVLMALDKSALGDPPAKLSIDVPGATPGKAGEGLRRPDTGKIDVNEPPGMSKRNAPVPADHPIVPVKAESTDDGPPIAVKPFLPSM